MTSKLAEILGLGWAPEELGEGRDLGRSSSQKGVGGGASEVPLRRLRASFSESVGAGGGLRLEGGA